jgi:hypothetical protein
MNSPTESGPLTMRTVARHLLLFAVWAAVLAVAGGGRLQAAYATREQEGADDDP